MVIEEVHYQVGNQSRLRDLFPNAADIRAPVPSKTNTEEIDRLIPAGLSVTELFDEDHE